MPNVWCEWALTSMFLIVVVLSLRAVLARHISARLRYTLWAVVLLRLLVPVQLFTAPVSGMGMMGHHEEQTTDLDLSGLTDETTAPVLAAPQVQGQVNAQYETHSNKQNGTPSAAIITWESAQGALGALWLGGAIAAGLILLLTNLRFAADLRRRRLPLKNEDCLLPVYEVEGLPSPCLFGVFQPTVYVTPAAAKNPVMLRHVLAHEETHARHLDHVWSVLRCAVLAIHWWNPLVWLAATLSRRDSELACDEGTLQLLGDSERKAYGCTLLTLVTAEPTLIQLFNCATTMAGNKKALWERVSRIAKGSTQLMWAVVLAVVIAVSATACSFTQVSTPGEASLNPDNSVSVENEQPVSNSTAPQASTPGEVSPNPGNSVSVPVESEQPASSSTAPVESMAPTKPEDNEEDPETSGIPAADSILKAFQGEGYFYSTAFGKKLTFDNYLVDPVTESGLTLEISQFAVVDLDGDGINEVVLQLILDEHVEAGRAIFHCQDGKVYEYELPVRGLWHIKTDGTFEEYDGVGARGYGRISFTDKEYKSEFFTYCRSNRFFVDNKETSEAAFWDAVDQQDGKADVAWNNFSNSDLAAFLD